jgi:ribokinase
MSARIVVLGSVNMDLVLQCDRLPAPGETVHGRSFHTWPGGKGANQAVAAARLGAAVSFVGCVGDDAFGAQAAEALRHEGVNTSHLRVVAGVPTGVAMITVDSAGRNSIALAAGANACLNGPDVAAATNLIRSAALLVCQLETPLPTVEQAVAVAFSHGVPVLLNPAPGAPLPKSLLAMVGVLVPNESEAALIDARCASAANPAAILAHDGPRRVVVTLGERGVAVADESGAWTAPAEAVVPLDTTGAGDTFVGALAAAMVDGQSFRDAVEYAQQAAAISVTRAGAMMAMPRLHEHPRRPG